MELTPDRFISTQTIVSPFQGFLWILLGHDNSQGCGGLRWAVRIAPSSLPPHPPNHLLKFTSGWALEGTRATLQSML